MVWKVSLQLWLKTSHLSKSMFIPSIHMPVLFYEWVVCARVSNECNCVYILCKQVYIVVKHAWENTRRVKCFVYVPVDQRCVMPVRSHSIASKSWVTGCSLSTHNTSLVLPIAIVGSTYEYIFLPEELAIVVCLPATVDDQGSLSLTIAHLCYISPHLVATHPIISRAQI